MTEAVASAPKGYRLSQIVVHWLIFALVAFLFVTGDNMSDAWREMVKGGGAATGSAWMPIHIGVGLAVFAAALARIGLRRRYGAPPPPEAEAKPLRLLAVAVHHTLNLILLIAPVLGLAAFLFASRLFGQAHEFLVRAPILVLVGLHVVGALYHHFVLKDDVLIRMKRPLAG